MVKYKYRVNGIGVVLKKPDLNKDGRVDEYEAVTQRVHDADMIPVQTPTELGESLRELNLDDTDPISRTSTIDLRANLSGEYQAMMLTAADALVSMKVLSKRILPLTRQVKRISVSIKGRGRDDVVNIVGGKREVEGAKGFGERLKGFFTGNK